VGRYADASAANRQAIAVDRRYLALTRPPGTYPMYVGHNWGFLAFSTAMEGRATESIAAARAAAQALPPEMLSMMPGMDFFAAETLMAMVRFGKWEEIRSEPRPPAAYEVQTALWLHARGMAHALTGRVDDATRDLASSRAGGVVPPDLQRQQRARLADVAILSLTRASPRRETSRRGQRPLAAGRRRAGSPRLRRARRLVLSAAPLPGRRAAGLRAAARRRGRLSRGPAQEPRQRLGALRPRPGAARAKPQPGGRRRRGRLPASVGERGLHAPPQRVLV
jgi:hypothetical protein